MHHSSFLFSTSPKFRYLFEALFNAHAAVVVFFVLSGYLLTRSLVGSRNIMADAPVFLARRLFRILPAIWAVGAVSALYLVFMHNHIDTPQQSAWYVRMYPQGPVSQREVALSFFALTSSLTPPLWSVRIELLASVLIPAMAICIKRHFHVALALSGLMLSLFVFNRTETLLYMNSFIFGALLIDPPRWLRAFAGTRGVVIFSALILLFFRLFSPDWRFEVDYAAKIPTLVESAAAALLILALVVRGAPLLQGRWMRWVGDISFSVFLLHFVIMSALATMVGRLPIGPDLAALTLMGATLAVTLPVANGFYRFVELPGIELGKRVITNVRRVFPQTHGQVGRARNYLGARSVADPRA